MLDGHEQNPKVKPKRPAADVIQVVLDALAERGPATIAVNLRPAGHARRNGVSKVVIGNLGAEAIDEDRPFRPRSDEAHIAVENIDQLRKFVDVCMSQPRADRRAAFVVIDRPDRPGSAFGVVPHAPEFPDAKETAPLTDPFLGVKDRPAGRDKDRQGGDEKQRREREQSQAGTEDIEQSFEQAPPVQRPRNRRGHGATAEGVGPRKFVRDPMDPNRAVGQAFNDGSKPAGASA